MIRVNQQLTTGLGLPLYEEHADWLHEERDKLMAFVAHDADLHDLLMQRGVGRNRRGAGLTLPGRGWVEE